MVRIGAKPKQVIAALLSFNPGALACLVRDSLLFLRVVVGGYFPGGKMGRGVDRRPERRLPGIPGPRSAHGAAGLVPANRSFSGPEREGGPRVDAGSGRRFRRQSAPQSCDERVARPDAWHNPGATQTGRYRLIESTCYPALSTGGQLQSEVHQEWPGRKKYHRTLPTMVNRTP